MTTDDSNLGGTGKDLLLPLVVGAIIACGSLISLLIKEGPDLPAYVSIPLGVTGILAMPGLILSLILTGSLHDPKLVLGTVLNCIMYAALFSASRAYRKRKRNRFKAHEKS